MSVRTKQVTRISDYFVICGLDIHSGLEQDLACDITASPLERSFKCKVLEHYPHSVTWNPFDQNAVSMLCLPHGLQFRTQKNLTDPKFHSFVITREDGSRYYGFSFVFYEKVRNAKICNAIATLQSMHLAEVSSQKSANRLVTKDAHSHSLPRHFKLSLSQTAKITQNYYDSTKDTLYVNKSIALIMQLPFVEIAKAFLTKLHRYAFTKPKHPEQLSVESFIYNFLYEVPLPGPGRSVKVEIIKGPMCMIIQRPITIEELPLLDFSLCDLFSLLSIDTIIQVFICILLENQVLICSSDYQKLMLVAECLVSLLFPFTWQHVYVPILPSSLQHFLDAPVPFIMGLPSQEAQPQFASEADLCHINVDTGMIQVPEERPNFPRKAEFCRKLADLCAKHKVPCMKSISTDLMSSSLIISNDFPESITRNRKHSWSNSETDEKSHLQIHRNFCQNDIDSTEHDSANHNNDSDDDIDSINRHLDQLIFNNAVRETFLHSFVNIFESYEKFVMFPKEEDKEEWFNNRESMQNFDKTTFLCDQPACDLPFLSQFLETQMFASLIDLKILSHFHENDPNLRVFDKRIRNFRKRLNHEDYESAAIRESQPLIEKRFNQVDYVVPSPKEVLPMPSEHFRLMKRPINFPSLDPTVLNKEPTRRSHSGSTNNHRKHRFEDSLKRDKDNAAHSSARIAQANWNFVAKLLMDCKSKTNRMVMAKMSAEGVNVGKDELDNVEENTLIASLCDLLEKIWSHGMQQKQGKSALWSHLLRFCKKESGETLEEVSHMSPDLSSLALEPDVLSLRSNEPSPCSTPDNRSLDRNQVRGSTLKALPVSVTFDVRNIEAMTEIKSEIGYSRAWIRLSLEKKLLSQHLQALLADTTLLKLQYRRNAFLRCDEEKEQFLFHLLSLNAVDYYCFTNTYLTAKLLYRLVIYPVRKTALSATTANVWIAISGTNGETGQLPIPKNTADYLFPHKNLGLLTTLRIGHDNSGLSPNWLVDYVIVRCEVTGHTYKFGCGRHLGRNVDDGSIERLLIGELVKPVKLTDPSLMMMPSLGRRESASSSSACKLSVAELQHMIGDAVNNIVKYFHRHGNHARQTGALTSLLCGEMGLVHSLQLAFAHGFRANRLFGRNYLWDFFVKAKEAHESSTRPRPRDCGSLDRHSNRVLNQLNNNNMSATLNRLPLDTRWRVMTSHDHIPRASERQTPRSTNPSTPLADSDAMLIYCRLVNRIDLAGKSLGKDGMFQRFICLAVRSKILHRVLDTLAESRPAMEMYEEDSFLRDRTLRVFLIEILASLADYEFRLEATLTVGIDDDKV